MKQGKRGDIVGSFIRVVIVFIVILGLIGLFILSIGKCLNDVNRLMEEVERKGVKSIAEEIWYGEEK